MAVNLTVIHSPCYLFTSLSHLVSNSSVLGKAIIEKEARKKASERSVGKKLERERLGKRLGKKLEKEARKEAREGG